MVSTKRATLKAYALVAGVFLFGAVAGGAAMHAFSQRDVKALLGREGFERRRLGALAQELELTDEQHTRLREIFRRRGEERRKLTAEVMERCGSSLEEHERQMDAEIRAVLSEPQAARFEQLMEQRGPRRRPRRGPGR